MNWFALSKTKRRQRRLTVTKRRWSIWREILLGDYPPAVALLVREHAARGAERAVQRQRGHTLAGPAQQEAATQHCRHGRLQLRAFSVAPRQLRSRHIGGAEAHLSVPAPQPPRQGPAPKSATRTHPAGHAKRNLLRAHSVPRSVQRTRTTTRPPKGGRGV